MYNDGNYKKKNNLFLYILLVLMLIILISSSILYILNNNVNSIENNNYSYLCDEGYELINNKCYKIIETTDANIEYTCDNGYYLNGNQCNKIEYSKNFITEWTCPNGYEMEKGRTPNICYKTNTVASLVQHYCKDGGYLSGEKCIKTEQVPAKEIIACEAWWVYDSTDGLCHSSLFLFNSCPSGAKIVGKVGQKYLCAIKPTFLYECPDGKVKSYETTCDVTEEYEAQAIIRCPGDNYKMSEDKTKCTITEYDVPSYKIKCGEDGYVYENNHCVKTISVNANIKEYCNNEYVLKDGNCIKYDIQEPLIDYK